MKIEIAAFLIKLCVFSIGANFSFVTNLSSIVLRHFPGCSAKEVYILEIPGTWKSKGVEAEIKIAREFNKKISVITYNCDFIHKDF